MGRRQRQMWIRDRRDIGKGPWTPGGDRIIVACMQGVGGWREVARDVARYVARAAWRVTLRVML